MVNTLGLDNRTHYYLGVFPNKLRRGYTRRGMERLPRGRSCISRHSALLPMAMPTARESDPTARGSSEIFHNSLMAESGRIELRRVSPRLTAYKAASTPNGLRFPYQKADAVRRHRLTKLESGARFELAYGPLQTDCLSSLATRTLVTET